jgi:hypothetical protein
MHRRRTIHLARVTSALLAATTVTAGLAPAAFAGDVKKCPPGSTASWCLGGTTGGGGTGGGTGGQPGTPGPPTKPPPCGWEAVPASVVLPWLKSTSGAVEDGPPPPGADVTWQAWCYREASGGGTYGGPFRWVLVATPQTVAAGLAQQIRGTVPEPEVRTDPPAGTAAVVGVPVFVDITNWQGTIVRHGTLVGIGVTVVATPSVIVDAGDGTNPHTCDGPGRLYDPAAGDLWAQADAAGACTLTYAKRTGVSGRPGTWASTATVRWTITWSSTDGDGGIFPDVDRTITLPRQVHEVQTIVTSGG